jgi:hypothetical protein
MILDNTKVAEGLEMFVVVKVDDFSHGELRVMNFRCSLTLPYTAVGLYDFRP